MHILVGKIEADLRSILSVMGVLNAPWNDKRVYGPVSKTILKSSR